jgi:hypothetical protein
VLLPAGERVLVGRHGRHHQVGVDHRATVGDAADGVQQTVGRRVLVDHARHVGGEQPLEQPGRPRHGQRHDLAFGQPAAQFAHGRQTQLVRHVRGHHGHIRPQPQCDGHDVVVALQIGYHLHVLLVG